MANNFSLILTFITLIIGIIWIFSRFKYIFYKNTKKFKKINNKETKNQLNLLDNIHKKKMSFVDSCASVFPILMIVLAIRSFIYEPFQIPSGSMIPTLLVGDFILVKKFAYGLKDPITGTTFFTIGRPKRGDVAVFKYPKDLSVDFIKRVIGIPGDRIIYSPEKKELRICPNYSILNCAQELSINYSELKESQWTLFFNNNSILNNKKGNYLIPFSELIPNNALRYSEKVENIDNINYKILVIPEVYTESIYQQPGLPDNEWIVPPKHYFMMGDNRDNSSDSRMWGFVPEENLVGKAVIIWFSFDKHEDEWPTGVRLNHVGKIR
ncbi:signal peptidase I [Arsenophonus endosymbiont of Lipoptena cervi]|uniref:signal peptidase I n=1 Tax=Arsenophonus endosymbiont of Lipoptena cervi TaxID=363258 RepID=UPI00376EC805